MRAYLGILLFLLSYVLLAQDSLGRKPFFKLCGFSIQYGVPGENSEYIPKNVLADIWPNFNSRPYFNYTIPLNWYYSDGRSQIALHTTFDNYRKRKQKYSVNSQTLVGLVLSREQKLYYSQGNVYARRYDTLYSSAGNPNVYRDYVIVNSVQLAYYISSLGLEVQQLFSTNAQKMLSLYAGVGVSAQYSLLSQIEEHTEKKYGYYATQDPHFDYQNSNNFGTFYYSIKDGLDSTGGPQLYKAEKAALYKLYIPFGLNIRLSQNEQKLVSNIHLFFQTRLGWESLRIRGVQQFYDGNLTFCGGLKYRF